MLFFDKNKTGDKQESAFLGEYSSAVFPLPPKVKISKPIPNYHDSINLTEIISIPPANHEPDILDQLDLVPDPPNYSIVTKSLNFENKKAENGLQVSYAVDKKPVSCNSTLDRPIKPHNFQEIYSSIDQQEKFSKVTCVDPELLAGLNSSNLLVDLQKLSESLKILRDSTSIQSQSSSIERPRSTGSAYHMLPTMQSH
uniref:Uncharacterized protein n=1 Tax=Panagrolaimus sp. JU765 TaxID=591449 RepID=A0AC34Q979_9BILA